MAFETSPLPYALDALAPSIDATTMEIHSQKHWAAYTSKLNAAVEGTELAGKTIEDLLANLDQAPADKQGALRNNGGGYFNHRLFFSTLTPGGGDPAGDLAAAMDRDLGGMDAFKEAFGNAAATRFGSGWAWLIVCPEGKLHVSSTANQDVPFMPTAFGGQGKGYTPILGGRYILGGQDISMAKFLDYLAPHSQKKLPQKTVPYALAALTAHGAFYQFALYVDEI